jgi:hypothetical protein
MAAGTETAVDTRGSANLVGNIVEKVLLARQLAENERKFAAKKAEEAGTSLEEAGIERGHFFKKALQGEFGGNYIDRKKNDLRNVVRKYKIAKRITKNPKAAFKFIKPLLEKNTTSAQTKMFRAKFDYSYSDDVTRPQPLTPVAGATAKKIRKATSSSGRVSKEQLLSTLTDLIDSLNKTAESIGKNTSGMSSGIISATHAQHEIVEQLKERNNTLEDKLDKIAEAISNQTQIHKKIVSKAKISRAEQNLEDIQDVASVEVPDDLQTKENETTVSQVAQNITPTTNIINNQTIETGSSRPLGGYPSMSGISKAGMDIPQYETGGIVSGPNSGYLAKVPKGTRIDPIDNNYTRGKPSAVDGKVRPIPAETGMKSSSVGGKFGFGITSMTGIGRGGTTQGSALSQPLMDAMTLPMMVTGGSVLSTVSKLISSMGSEGGSIAPELEKIARPIADVFGLPPSIVKRAKQGSSTTASKEEKTEESGESKKNIFAKLMDGFGAMLDKMKDGINNTPPNNTPPGQTDLSPVNLQGFGEKEISNLGKMVYAESGATEGGSSHVLNAILNRYRQVKQGKATPQAWGVRSGVTSEQMTITDLLNAENQFQPMRDGRFDKVSEEQGRAALNAAIKGGGLSPAEIKTKAIATGMSEQDASLLAVADTFYNPTVSSNKPFRDAPVVNTDNKHAFMSSPNTGFKPGDLSKLQPVVQTSPSLPQKPVSPGQAITNNYGLKVGQERTFTVPGYGEVKAHKTETGFEFFGPGINNILDLSKPQGKSIVEYFKSTNGGQDIRPTDLPPQASINPPPGARKTEQTQTLAQEIDSSGNNIVAMLMPTGQQPQTASTALPSMAETTTAGKGGNPLGNTGLYSESYG